MRLTIYYYYANTIYDGLKIHQQVNGAHAPRLSSFYTMVSYMFVSYLWQYHSP